MESRYLEALKEIAIKRRTFLIGSALLATGGIVGTLRLGGPLLTPGIFPEVWGKVPNLQPPESPVAILPAASYDVDLATLITQAIDLCKLEVRGKRVLLKPNLVEFNPDKPINTNARVVEAAIEAFRRKDAREVIVGEGAGHRRDTELLVEATGLMEVLRKTKTPFVDLNLDDLAPRKLVSPFMHVNEMFFSKTLLGVDLLVSMPKLKTHHWAGATLGMKNLYGCVPGAVYGWPKNFLHWCGIDECIVDIAAALRPGFCIVDGVVGMEGDGPINGTARPFGHLICGSDIVAVDATCARLMGLDPERLNYLNGAGEFLGHIQDKNIAQRGEAWQPLEQQFAVVKKFEFMRRNA